jgi:hypothetical protein
MVTSENERLQKKELRRRYDRMNVERETSPFM